MITCALYTTLAFTMFSHVTCIYCDIYCDLYSPLIFPLSLFSREIFLSRFLFSNPVHLLSRVHLLLLLFFYYFFKQKIKIYSCTYYRIDYLPMLFFPPHTHTHFHTILVSRHFYTMNFFHVIRANTDPHTMLFHFHFYTQILKVSV